MRNNAFLLAAAAVSIPAALAAPANAIGLGDTLILSRSVPATLGRSVDFIYDSSRTSGQAVDPSATGSYAQAGLNFFDVSGGGSVMAFCVEVKENFPDDPISYTVVDASTVPEEAPPGPMGATRFDLVQSLYANFYDDASSTGGDDSSFSNSADESSAFQLVLWEITHENFAASTASGMISEMDIELGAMAITSFQNANILTIANTMIAGLGSGSVFNMFGLSNPTNQDLLIVVPSPAIAGLAGLGLVGMRRRRR